MSSTTSRFRRPIKIVIGAVAVLVVYGVLAVELVGLAWPYPVLLPASFKFDGNTYRKQATCHTIARYAAERDIDGRRTRMVRVGSLPSALWIGRPPIYSYPLHPRFAPNWDWVVVKDGSCYRFYEGDQQD